MTVTRDDWMLTWVSLIHAATHFRAGLEKRFQEEFGFGLSEQDLMKQLKMNDGQLRLNELGDRIYFSKAGITKMLDRLEKADLVKREPLPGDRRAMTARLTEHGEAVFKRSRITLADYVRRVLRDPLSDQAILSLQSGLTSLLDAHDLLDGQARHLRGDP